MSESTQNLRTLWKEFECKENSMVLIPFGPDKIRVAPPTAIAWQALAMVFEHHRYHIRTTDTDSYNCRNIKGTNQKSLHSYGIALDVNWNTNPFINHSGTRKVRFSDKSTQDERAEDVRLGRADTDMTPRMIEDALAIRTIAGKQVFEWGGHYTKSKDAMHFEIDVSPQDLASGIDTTTVAGFSSQPEMPTENTITVDAPAVPSTPPTSTATGLGPHVVIARSGLRLRSGPSTNFDVLGKIPNGTIVHVLSSKEDWMLVDLQGDGNADGFMHGDFLRPLSANEGVHRAQIDTRSDILDRVTADLAARLFTSTTRRANIENNLPFVLSGLREHGLSDRPMVLMALATIRAETEGFVPISEGRSRFNTRNAPFDLYDAGTAIGRRLGNSQAGDGPRFKGRGYVQLTGRFNYTRIGEQLSVDLVGNPELANDPTTAGRILARFIKNKEGEVRQALDHNDLRKARRLVNGGSHGLDRFQDAYERGLQALPA